MTTPGSYRRKKGLWIFPPVVAVAAFAALALPVAATIASAPAAQATTASYLNCVATIGIPFETNTAIQVGRVIVADLSSHRYSTLQEEQMLSSSFGLTTDQSYHLMVCAVSQRP